MTGESAIKLIKAYIAQNKWSNVIDLCTSHLKDNPQRIEFYPCLAKAYSNQGRLTEAIAAYQKVLDTPLNQAEIHAELGLLYSKKKQFVKAAWHYQQAININPNWAELHYNLAVVLHRLGDWKQTIAAYKEALRIKPNYAAVYFNLGVLYDGREELETAIDRYQQAIKIKPNHLKAYSNLASTLAKQKKYSTAIEVLQKGLNIDPTWSTLHNNLGQIYLLNGQSDKASDSFEMAICLDSTMSLAYGNLGKLWQQQGNLVRAVENFKKQIILEPKNMAAFGNLAGLLLRQKKFDRAIKYLRQAIFIDSSFIESYLAKNQTSESRDLLTKAKASCVKFLISLQKEASKAEVLNHLWQTYSYWGDVSFECGNAKQAEFYYLEALNIKSDEVSIYLNLGNSLVKQKRSNAAVNIYKMGLALKPHCQEIESRLATIAKKLPSSSQKANNNQYEANFNSSPQNSNSSRLLSSENTSLNLPQKIYHHTRDWVRDCQIEDYSYIEVFWEGTKPINREHKQIAVTPESESYPYFSECGGFYCHDCTAQLIEFFQPINIGSRSYQCSLIDCPDIFAPLPFVVSFPQGVVWNTSQKNKEMSDDAVAIITSDRFLLGDVSRYAPWFLFPCPYKEKKTHPIFELDSLPNLTKLKGKVAVLSGLAENSYYHWMFDILPRLEILRLGEIDLESIDWFVVNNLEQPFQKESLKILGIPLNKIIKSDRTSFIEAEELIVPSFPGYLQWISFGTIKFLRQTFLLHTSQNKTSDKSKLYISRERAKVRRVLNEVALVEFLAKWGFTTVYLEEMSLTEQISLFANAKTIVAPHGSGLTNLVFCSPRTTVIELFSPDCIRPDYWILSQQLDLKHYYCLGESFNCSPLQNIMYRSSLTEDILIDFSSLEIVFRAAGVVET